MPETKKTLISYIKETLLLMVGLPDYDAYVRHRLARHADRPVMSREEFFRERQENRYGANGKTNRCC
ncbi:MAG: hypothetical protein A3G18_10755 [Rhodospirillales bacterium RIFCSPLOWO2_12_FULL_58_28]|nr:MAG: hypothetical protein A3H92_11110 [Rhodospirillales bacterium RIFCSPLOWO2_02_FULL_58_16]OHC77899.1 MAG: hypothetical protein A3G18_10755 [Rhodospirillales bacterium RIFCSPLOWO2_12_FULL_58_28]